MYNRRKQMTVLLTRVDTPKLNERISCFAYRLFCQIVEFVALFLKTHPSSICQA